MKLGVIVVDHGSKRSESNDLLPELVEQLKAANAWRIVEPAHMELAEPSIASAFARCVEQGAEHVVVHPYFLGPGRHWREDIPRLAQQAAAEHEGISHQVTAPLGPHPLLLEIVRERVSDALTKNDP